MIGEGPSPSAPKGKKMPIYDDTVTIKIGKNYVFRFDHTSPNWSNYQDYNQLFVTMTQNRFNDLLNSRGYVFLNEILVFMGIKPCVSGQVVGWTRGDTISILIRDAYTHGMVSTGFVLQFIPSGIILDELQ